MITMITTIVIIAIILRIIIMIVIIQVIIIIKTEIIYSNNFLSVHFPVFSACHKIKQKHTPWGTGNPYHGSCSSLETRNMERLCFLCL